MKKTKNYEITHPGASLSYKGVNFPSGLAIGLGIWVAGLLAIPAKITYDHFFKQKEMQEINQLHTPKTQKEDLKPNKLFDIEQSYAVPDKLTVNKTYQVAPTFENVADKYL